MSVPTTRDQAWHAIFVTALQTDGTFAGSDVKRTADELDADVSIRTIRKVLKVMDQFGYLQKAEHGRGQYYLAWSRPDGGSRGVPSVRVFSGP